MTAITVAGAAALPLRRTTRTAPAARRRPSPARLVGRRTGHAIPQPPLQCRRAQLCALINPDVQSDDRYQPRGDPLEQRRLGKELARKEVAAAAETVDRLMKAVLREMMIAEGVVSVMGEEHRDTTLKEAIQGCLLQETDNLSDVFLATLMQFTKAATDKGQEQAAAILAAIYEETILYVESKMPSEMRLLSELIEQPVARVRQERIDIAITTTGRDGEPEYNLEALAITANRMVEDMEKRTSIPDRGLLLRMCLVREELRVTALRNGQMSPELVKFQTVIPARVSHFVKELIPVGDAARRLALMEKVLRGDWEGAAPKLMGTQKERINRAKFRLPEDDVPDVVRPGALLSTLLRLQVAMEADKDKIADNKRKLTRVAEIRNEALTVMKRIAFDDKSYSM